MKNVLNITVSFAILFSSFMTIDSLAIIQLRHKLGFIKAKEAQEFLYGPTWYSLSNNANMNETIFYERSISSNYSALINIDGQDISLKMITRKYKNPERSRLIKVAEYKSQLFRVKLRDFRDITTAKDKKGCARRVTGFMEITGNDGWTKKLQVYSGEDVCG